MTMVLCWMMGLQIHLTPRNHEAPTTSNGWNNLLLKLTWNPRPWTLWPRFSRMMNAWSSTSTWTFSRIGNRKFLKGIQWRIWFANSTAQKSIFSVWALQTLNSSEGQSRKKFTVLYRTKQYVAASTAAR